MKNYFEIDFMVNIMAIPCGICKHRNDKGENCKECPFYGIDSKQVHDFVKELNIVVDNYQHGG